MSQLIRSTAPIKTAPGATTTTSSSGGLGLFDESDGGEDLFTTLATQNQSMYQTYSDNAKYVDRVYKVEDLSPNLIRKNWKST